MNKVKNTIMNISFIILFILFAIIIFCNCFYNKKLPSNITFFRLLLGIIIYGALSFLFYMLYKKIKNKKMFFIIFFCIFFIIQCTFTYLFMVIPSWDYGIVFDAAKESVLGTKAMLSNWYFYMYPNNIGLGIFYKVIFLLFKILRFTSPFYLSGLLLINILAIDISIFYTYKIIKTFIDKDISMFLIMCMMFITPFITYCPIAYSDTLSMPFIISSLYYFIMYFIIKDQSKKNIILSIVLLGIGSIIKFSACILLVAYIIYIIFMNKALLKKLIYVLIICFMFLITYFPVKLSEYMYLKPDVLKQKKMPITHWIMMGLHEDRISVGGYYEEDVSYTLSFNNTDLKREKNIEVIRQRLHNYRLNNDLIGFYLRKLIYVWGDGTFYAPNKLWLMPKRDYQIKNFITGSMYQTITFRLFAQSEWIIILILFSLSLLFNKYLKEEQRKLLFISSIITFGVILFFLIWEARSRYLINVLPIIIINASLGIIAIKNKIASKKVR